MHKKRNKNFDTKEIGTQARRRTKEQKDTIKPNK